MKCPNCGSNNHHRRVSCKECGWPLKPSGEEKPSRTQRPAKKKPAPVSPQKQERPADVSPAAAKEKPPLIPSPAEERPPRQPDTMGITIMEPLKPVSVSVPTDNFVCPDPSCRYQNRPGMFFCYQCGTPLYHMTELPADRRPLQIENSSPQPTKQAKLVLADQSEILITSSEQSIGRDQLKKAVPPERKLWISREHFWIYSENDRYYIEDRRSTNDTLLNGNTIRGTGKIELQDGDQIEVSPTPEGPATTGTFRIFSN